VTTSAQAARSAESREIRHKADELSRYRITPPGLSQPPGGARTPRSPTPAASVA
jgi:hypothetical protein